MSLRTLLAFRGLRPDTTQSVLANTSRKAQASTSASVRTATGRWGKVIYCASDRASRVSTISICSSSSTTLPPATDLPCIQHT